MPFWWDNSGKALVTSASSSSPYWILENSAVTSASTATSLSWTNDATPVTWNAGVIASNYAVELGTWLDAMRVLQTADDRPHLSNAQYSAELLRRPLDVWKQVNNMLWTTPIPEPAEQAAVHEQWEAEQAQHEARIAAARAEHIRANERAEKLLVEHLSPQQAEELRLHGHFHVWSLTGKHYRISRGQHGNVSEVRGGRALRSLCVQPQGNLPDADAMLAQKLWLETDEATLLSVANISQIRAYA